MPNWLLEILMVWNYRSRSLWLIILGLTASFLLPLVMDWYWSGVELHGQLESLKPILSENFIHRAHKVGFWIMIGCFISAFKAYRTDRKRMLKHF